MSQIKKGAASTLNSGTVKTMTRGVNIENANFEGKDLTVRYTCRQEVVTGLKRKSSKQ